MISMKSSFGKGFPSCVSSAAKAMLRPSMANQLVGSRSLNMKVGSIISFGIDTFYTFFRLITPFSFRSAAAQLNISNDNSLDL